MTRAVLRRPVLLGRDPPSGSGPTFWLEFSIVVRFRQRRVQLASLGDRLASFVADLDLM